jgi:hypothetical protein
VSHFSTSQRFVRTSRTLKTHPQHFSFGSQEEWWQSAEFVVLSSVSVLGFDRQTSTELPMGFKRPGSISVIPYYEGERNLNWLSLKTRLWNYKTVTTLTFVSSFRCQVVQAEQPCQKIWLYCPWATLPWRKSTTIFRNVANYLPVDIA